uniref:Fibronectin type-II domain-containing protein n=1 Tax=Scleropages formosus TaxID=113540 RepID=A0A8C9W3S2_SCLFO
MSTLILFRMKRIVLFHTFMFMFQQSMIFLQITAFPFKYNGKLYFSCTSVDSKHQRLWCSLTSDYDQDRLWGCSARYGQLSDDISKNHKPSSCVFPFTVGGKTYNRCTTDYWLPGIPWCSTTANYDQDKQWSYCPSSEYDISPNYCVFPFKYNGQLYFSCTSVDSKHERLWCSLTSDYDQDRLWESSCVFPFTVGGKTYNRCTTDYWLPGIPWCSTTANYDQDKKWSYCPSSEYDISPNYCVFPFKYNGQLYFSCTSVDSKHERLWCSLTSDYDQDRLWGYCLGNTNQCELQSHLTTACSVARE